MSQQLRQVTSAEIAQPMNPPPVMPGDSSAPVTYNDPTSPNSSAEGQLHSSQGPPMDSEANSSGANDLSPTVTMGIPPLDRETIALLAYTKDALEITARQPKDPKATHPKLGLTGRVITATFVMPFNIEFIDNSEWVGPLPLLPLHMC